MDVSHKPKKDECPADQFVQPGGRDIQVQLVLSVALGISAFLAFAVRPLTGPGLIAASG